MSENNLKRVLRTSQYKESMDKKDLKRGLNTSQYKKSMDKKDLKRGVKTRSYNMDMNKKDLDTLNEKTPIYCIDMNERDLEKLSKSELIKMLLKQKKSKKVRNHEDLLYNDPFKDKVSQPITLPQKSARHIPSRDSKTGRFIKIHPDRLKQPKQPTLPRLRDAKGKFISRQQSEPVVQQAPIQIQTKPPKPTRKPPPPPILQLEEKESITNVPSPKIKKLNTALKGHAKSYGIELQNQLNPLNHFTKTKELVESHLEGLLKDMKGSNSLKRWR